MGIATMRVVNPDDPSKVMIINAVDYDPKRYTRIDDKIQEAETDKEKVQKIKDAARDPNEDPNAEPTTPTPLEAGPALAIMAERLKKEQDIEKQPRGKHHKTLAEENAEAEGKSTEKPGKEFVTKESTPSPSPTPPEK